MIRFDRKMIFVMISLFMILVFYNARASERVEEINKIINNVKSDNEIEAAVAAQEALNSKDPLLRSKVLEIALENRFPRVRSIGFRYLVENQKRLVVVATPTEEALNSIKYIGDKNQLLSSLNLEFTFEDYEEKTSRFKMKSQRWGNGEGAIGLDGLTITTYHNKLNLNSVFSGTLVGTASYRLSNTPIPVVLQAKAALP